MDLAYEQDMELPEAAAIGNIELVNQLMKLKANVNTQNKVNGRTALHWACSRGHANIVQLLLVNAADIELKDFAGKTALDCAHKSLQHLCKNRFNPVPNQIIGSVEPMPSAIVPSYIAAPDVVIL
jgi:ankyrin repeat protein